MAEINEYKTGAQSNYGFPLTFDVSKKAPAIAKRIWGTYNDALAWVNDPNQNAVAGLQLSVINDTDAKKNGVYFVSKIGEGAVDESGKYTGGELIKVGDGTGSLAINRPTIDDAGKVAEAAADNIGQIIYITTAPSPDATDEDKKYGIGPYIVTGEGTLSSIGITNVDNPDLSSTVAALGGRVSTLEEAVTKETTGLLAVVGNADSGLVKKTNDLDTNKVDKVEGSRLMTEAEGTKLAGIAEGAQVNVIESVKVDGVALDVADKAVDITLPVTGVSADDKILLLDGKSIKSTLSFTREEVNGKDSLVVKGKDGVIGSVEVADFVADGMLESVTPIEGTNEFKFTFKKVDGSTADFNVDFSKFVDTYNADGTTIELDSTSNTFKVKDGVFVSLDGYVAYSNDEKTKLAGIAEGAQVNILEVFNVKDGETTSPLIVTDKAVTLDLSAYAKSSVLDNYVQKAEGSRLMTEVEGTKLAGIAEGAQVNILEVFNVKDGEVTSPLIVTDKAVTLDLSAYAKNSVLNDYVQKVEGSRLMTEVEGTKLSGIEEGAQVNTIIGAKFNDTNVDVLDKYINLSSIFVTTGAEVEENNNAKGLTVGAALGAFYTKDDANQTFILSANNITTAEIDSIINGTGIN